MYGTFKYPKPKIKMILVGPTTLNIPYIPWKRMATEEYTDSSVITLSSGVNTPPAM